ncbi:MAG: ABC transporter ATP-binding protein [Chloroflexi bacterium]|nr:ABC transporter ATP-binding protein [Chloroflexota bacterium]
MPALTVSNLTKRYKDVLAVDDISFTVDDGEIFGILGPNGAGKTTTIELIEGLRKPDSGQITLLGVDATRQSSQLKERIGVQLQAVALIPNLTVWETLDMFSGLYRKRADRQSLLTRFALEDKRDSRVGKLSGGQRQRLSVALGLVNDPEIVFLDEPTTGLDPQARRALWDTVRDLAREGRTVILTTHYMEEAEQLCDRVAIMDHGRIITLDTPKNLVSSVAAERTIECTLIADIGDDVLGRLPGAQSVQAVDGFVTITTTEPTATIRALLNLESDSGPTVDDIRVRTATLEDVFISLTGRALRD